MVQRLLNAAFKKLVSLSAKFNVVPERGGFILLLRLENMPLLSDRLGQAGMTDFLVQLTIRLTVAIRPCDSVQTITSGVFAVILRSKTLADAMIMAMRIQQDCQQPFAVMDQTITPVLTGLLTPDHLLEASKTASAIRHGHQNMDVLEASHLGQISVVDSQLAYASESLPISVAQAVEMGQMIAYFQPKICCDTGSVTGFEILARWQHAARGVLSPEEFTPRMTTVDHHALTFAMLEQGLRALSAWASSGYVVPTVSINISVDELNDPCFSVRILQKLSQHSHPPKALIVEMMKSAGPADASTAARANLTRLRDAGCQFDLEDFGTCYAGLDAVRSLGVRRIKIDRSFINDCQSTPDKRRMILGIFALTEQLGITTIAKGVETPEEHGFLAQIGCSEVQGFAIARPMPFAATFIFLKNQRCRQQNLPDLPIRKK